MTEFDESTPAINEPVADHYCFGCGNRNPIGLKLRFRPVSGGGVWANFTPTRDHEGYLGMTHGGILSTVFDEAMSWAITDSGDIGVTARMSLTFRHPATVDVPLRVIGSVRRRRSRVIEADSEIYEIESGKVVAKAEARFIRVSKDQAERLQEAYGSGIDGSSFGLAAARNAGQISDDS